MFEQCQKHIIIMITITTKYWEKSIRDKNNTLSLDQKSSYKVWIKNLVRSLDQRPGLSQRSDIKELI